MLRLFRRSFLFRCVFRRCLGLGLRSGFWLGSRFFGRRSFFWGSLFGRRSSFPLRFGLRLLLLLLRLGFGLLFGFGFCFRGGGWLFGRRLLLFLGGLLFRLLPFLLRRAVFALTFLLRKDQRRLAG